MNPAQTRPIEILLVEDSETDELITRAALEQAKVVNRLRVVQDGEKAMKFLRQQEPYDDAPRPDLVLLDLNLPRKNGREVLAEIKADEALKTIPVVILTTSRAERDVLASYGLYANCYVVKPVDFMQLADVIRQIHQFWFCVVTLPSA